MSACALLERLPDRLARGEYAVEALGRSRDDEVRRFEAFFARALREIGSFAADARRDRRGPPGRGGDGAWVSAPGSPGAGPGASGAAP